MPIILSQMLEAYRWIGALLVLSAHSTNLFVSLARHHDRAPRRAGLCLVVRGQLRAWPSGGARLFRDVRLSRRRLGARQHPQGKGFSARICDPPFRAHLRRHRPRADPDASSSTASAATSCPTPIFTICRCSRAITAPASSSATSLISRRFTPRPTAPTARCGRSPASFGITSPFRCSSPRWRAIIPTGSVTAASRSESRFFYRWRARRGFASASCSGSSARWRACRSGR